jgi:hypothetical protein
VSFAKSLEIGRVAEGLISAWLQSRGNAIMPAYEIEKASGKGPQLFSAQGDFVSPDMLVFTANGIRWIEAKHKTHFTWHRISRQWTSGIDIRHYGDYLQVEKQTSLPVWLMFHHAESTPSADDLAHGSPLECPTGLFGGKLFDLVLTENHRSPHFDPTRTGMLGHGKSGMVYWAPNSLRLLATCEEVLAAAEALGRTKAAA